MSQTEVQLIKDAVIVNADISNSAAIDVSKISGAMPLAGGSFTDDVTFTGASANVTFDKSSNELLFADNAKASFGNNGDMVIKHTGSNSIIEDVGQGNLQIRGDDIHITGTNDEILAKFIENTGVELYHDGSSKKFETTSTGATVSGELTVTSNLLMGDGDKIRLGDSNDLELHHSSGENYIQGHTNQLYIRSAQGIYIQPNTNENGVVALANGAAELYHNNIKKLATDSTRGVLFTHDHGGNEPLCQAAAKGAFHSGFIADPDAGYQGHFRFARAGSLIAQIRNIADTTQLSMFFFNTNKEHDFFNNGTVEFDGNVRPKTDNSSDLGASDHRWANIYTNDLKLSNEGSENDVDRTWGNYTIQEGYEDLFLINHRTGKKFKFNLTEVA